MIYNDSIQLMADIRKYMDIHKITNKQLAITLGQSQQNVSKLLNSNNPTIYTIIKICEALDLQLDINFIAIDTPHD